MTFHANGGDVHDWLLLALVEHRLGHADAAKGAAAKARAILLPKSNSSIWESAEAELLITELDTALPPENK